MTLAQVIIAALLIAIAFYVRWKLTHLDTRVIDERAEDLDLASGRFLNLNNERGRVR